MVNKQWPLSSKPTFLYQLYDIGAGILLTPFLPSSCSFRLYHYKVLEGEHKIERGRRTSHCQFCSLVPSASPQQLFFTLAAANGFSLSFPPHHNVRTSLTVPLSDIPELRDLGLAPNDPSSKLLRYQQ